ncbi:hypothetical protein FDO65_04130 [Nakamurella flava]|uniref:Uncharacterized protein n=1 Tax=Nakamurella flava TaxID=2576308 RepID=A0A4U6QK42_9ACTN|nr:hypothetical protein [Nakamurella flava]TKV60860.1 hypothetical protein FDO65_04130 [Nakamurella flava]
MAVFAVVSVLLLLPVTGPSGGGGEPAEVSTVALLDPSAVMDERPIPGRDEAPLPASPPAVLVVVLVAVGLVRRSARTDQHRIPVGRPGRIPQPLSTLGWGATPGLLRV